MRQYYKRCTIIIVAGEEIREGDIGEVPNPAHYPLLYRPRIGSHPQHLQIVIRFHDQHVAAAQVILHTERNVTEISGQSDFDSLGTKRETYRIGSVMRNREWLYCDVSDLKSVSRFEALEFFKLRFHPILIAHRALPRLIRGPGHEHRDMQLFGQRRQPMDMIAVLVRDNDR